MIDKVDWENLHLRKYGIKYREDTETWREAYFRNSPQFLNPLNSVIQTEAKKPGFGLEFFGKEIYYIAKRPQIKHDAFQVVSCCYEGWTIEYQDTTRAQTRWYSGRSVRFFYAKKNTDLNEVFKYYNVDQHNTGKTYYLLKDVKECSQVLEVYKFFKEFVECHSNYG